MRPQRRSNRRPRGPGAGPLPKPTEDALLTIPQMPARYGGSVMTWYRRARARELPGAVLLRGRWYVRRLVFERWLAGEDAEGGSGAAGGRLRAV